MKCCANCIGDIYLRKQIFPSTTQETGNCEICQSEGVLLTEPGQLAEIFGPLINIYEPDENGNLLVFWLRQDWGLFRHERMDDARAKELLAEVLDDGEIVRQNFSPSPSYQTDSLARWQSLREELRFGNRFFPESGIDLDRLSDLLAHVILEADELPADWYRARLLHQSNAYSLNEMGAPPKELASHGRANPAGIPYLYLGSTSATAIAEIRPHTGETACVARFATAGELKVIDLRDPRSTVSPFMIQDEDWIGAMRGDLDFLERLGEELTRPVLPRSAAIDYVPSQYLCEFIKKSNYDGVIYRSSVGDGMNMALFNPDCATAQSVEMHSITRVSVEFE